MYNSWRANTYKETNENKSGTLQIGNTTLDKVTHISFERNIPITSRFPSSSI